jgi:hypothetical protein
MCVIDTSLKKLEILTTDLMGLYLMSLVGVDPLIFFDNPLLGHQVDHISPKEL